MTNVQPESVDDNFAVAADRPIHSLFHGSLYSSLPGRSSNSTSRVVVVFGVFHPWSHNIIHTSQFASMS